MKGRAMQLKLYEPGHFDVVDLFLTAAQVLFLWWAINEWKTSLLFWSATCVYLALVAIGYSIARSKGKARWPWEDRP